MKQRVIAILLLLGCVGVGALGFLTYKNQDRTAPVITVSDKKMSYTAGDPYDELLEGVTAEDDRDGDLTDEVFVDRVVPTSKKKAVVYYGVMDKSNNVGTARKTVTYHGDNNMGSDAADITPDASASDETDTADATQAENTADTQTSADQNQQSTDQPDATTDNLEAKGEKPAMSLTSTSETIARGSNFTALSVVKDVVDDKDDKDTLYRQLHVDGTYDTTKSGTYELTYYVQDSDGNTSDPITFTLTVQ